MEFLSLLSANLEWGHEEAIVGEFEADHCVGHASDFVEIIENILSENTLKQGPKVPFKLSTLNDQAVLDRKNRIIITSKDHGLIVYDHQAGTFTPYNNFKLKEERVGYAAILQ